MIGQEHLQKTLLDFSDKFDLINKSKKSCQDAIQNLLDDNNGDLSLIGGFEQEELIYEFNKQTFVFNSFITDTPFVRTEIGIYIKDKDSVWIRGLEPVGLYEMDTNLQGEDIDDWLTIDKTKDSSAIDRI